MFLSQRRDLKRKRRIDEDDLALQSWDTACQGISPLLVPPSLLPKTHPITQQRAQSPAVTDRSSSLEKGKVGSLHPRVFPCSLHSMGHWDCIYKLTSSR